MPDYLPKFKPGEAITRTASAAVVGGQLVTVAGTPCGGNAPDWLGVASQDAAAGALFGVYCDGVQRLVTAAAIPASSPVKTAAAGQIVAFVAGTDSPDLKVGLALEAAAAAGSVINVKLTR